MCLSHIKTIYKFLPLQNEYTLAIFFLFFFYHYLIICFKLFVVIKTARTSYKIFSFQIKQLRPLAWYCVCNLAQTLN